MVMRLSDGVAAPTMPKRPAPITAPKVQLHYDSPQISTMSGQTGLWTPPVGSNPSPITAPTFAQQYGGPSSGAQLPPNTGGGGGGMVGGPVGGPVGGTEASAPAGPMVGGRQWYNSLGTAQRAAEDAKYLRGDSDYTEQIGEYDKALQDFIDRITNRKTEYGEDATAATNSTNQNKQLTLDSMGEDFGARGLINSGMFVTEKDRAGTRFSDALKNINQVLTRNNSAADNELGDYRSENTIGRGNARRAALQRQLQNMSLIDSSAMF